MTDAERFLQEREKRRQEKEKNKNNSVYSDDAARFLAAREERRNKQQEQQKSSAYSKPKSTSNHLQTVANTNWMMKNSLLFEGSEPRKALEQASKQYVAAKTAENKVQELIARFRPQTETDGQTAGEQGKGGEA